LGPCQFPTQSDPEWLTGLTGFKGDRGKQRPEGLPEGVDSPEGAAVPPLEGSRHVSLRLNLLPALPDLCPEVWVSDHIYPISY
jgi:hypothetical protein